MCMHAFGNPDRPTILLLRSMGLPSQALFDGFREYMPGDYFIIFPEQGGYGKFRRI